MAKKQPKASASRGGLAASRRWILLQTVLLVGLFKETLEWLVLEQAPLPPLVKVGLGMVVVATTLGGFLLLAERRLQKGLGKVHRKAQQRYRLPATLFHLGALAAIFVAYAAFWNQETGALDTLQAYVLDGWQRLWAFAQG